MPIKWLYRRRRRSNIYTKNMFITYYTDFPNMIANPPLGYIIKYCALSPFWLKVINSLVVPRAEDVCGRSMCVSMCIRTAF